jgi:ribosomal protein L7/L12
MDWDAKTDYESITGNAAVAAYRAAIRNAALEEAASKMDRMGQNATEDGDKVAACVFEDAAAAIRALKSGTQQQPPMMTDAELALASVRPIDAIKAVKARLGCSLVEAKRIVDTARGIKSQFVSLPRDIAESLRHYLATKMYTKGGFGMETHRAEADGMDEGLSALNKALKEKP